MTDQSKGRCQHCDHELVMCGDCAEQVCLRPRCPGGLCECDRDGLATKHYRFKFEGATPETLAEALLRQRPKGNTRGLQSEAG